MVDLDERGGMPECDHDYQWHPESDDAGVCAKCGHEHPDEEAEDV